jgi:hypothetical protein
MGQEAVEPLAHLCGGFVGECDRQDIPARDPLLDQVGYAVRDGLGLPGSRACHDEERPLGMLYGLFLALVETGKV